MLNVGLSAADTQKYYADLAVTHEVRHSIRILDLSHNPVSGNVAAMLLDGQIDGQLIEVDRLSTSFDDFADPTILHTLSMQLLDPGYTLGFESSSPADAALYLDRMVEIVRWDFCPSLGVWVKCPLFCGPVNDLNRDGDVVIISAQSKEALAANQADIALTYGAGVKITAMIRDLLARTGEVGKYMDIPDQATVASSANVLLRESRPWSKAYWLARARGWYLFYDGRGVAKFTGSTTPVFRFDGSNMLSPPSRSYSTQNLTTTVRVVVGGGAGDAPKFDVTARLPASHPNSTFSLRRNGKNRAYLVRIDDDNIPTQAVAQARANAELTNRQHTVSGARFDAFCVPPLELGDYVHVVNEGRASVERVTAFTKPLRVDGVMSVGQTRLVAQPRRAV